MHYGETLNTRGLGMVRFCSLIKGGMSGYLGVFKGNLQLLTSVKLENGNAEFLYC